MKWVLRASGTNYFIRQDGRFTIDLDEAYNLPNIQAALELCRRRELIGMELVLQCGSLLEVSIQMGEVC